MDYYKILGIKRSANEQEIKQAYRRLAKRYHPDANHDDPTAETRFKEINEAYEVLGDPTKRARYDRYGMAARSRSTNGSRHGRTGETSFSDFFESFFGGLGRAARGKDIEQSVKISLREAHDGTTRQVVKGERRIKVSIPPGAATGTKIRLSNEGERGADGRPGDLYLVLDVEPSDEFEREGDDLITDVSVDAFTAMLGGEAPVQTMTRPVMLKIPVGTQAGQRFRITGKGMPLLKRPSEYGDLYARVRITVPRELTREQRQLAERLRESLK